MLTDENELEKACHEHLPLVIVRLLIKYIKDSCMLEGKFVKQWPLTSPKQIITDGQYLYICSGILEPAISRFSLHSSSFIENLKVPSLRAPSGIDISDNKLYILDYEGIKVFDLVSNTLINTWTNESGGWRFVKVWNFKLYVTVQSMNAIFIYNRKGTLLQKIGQCRDIKSDLEGQFHVPMGIAVVDSQFLAVCDHGNNRLQFFNIDSGAYTHLWDAKHDYHFNGPISIYLALDKLLYIGDNVGIQIFTKVGQFVFRLGNSKDGEFNNVAGMSSDGHLLYVSDARNSRLQVWE